MPALRKDLACLLRQPSWCVTVCFRALKARHSILTCVNNVGTYLDERSAKQATPTYTFPRGQPLSCTHPTTELVVSKVQGAYFLPCPDVRKVASQTIVGEVDGFK